MHAATRLVLVCTPLLVVPSGGCNWEKDAAAALLITLPVSYFLALPVLAAFVWLWRNRPEIPELEWRWLLSYSGVIGAFASITAFRPLPPPDYLSAALFYQALFLCTWLCVVARVAILLGSRWVIRIGTAFVLTALAVPAALVLFVKAAGSVDIMWVVIFVLVTPLRWLWGAILVLLFIEALARRNP